MQKLAMGDLQFVGLCHLLTSFSNYKYFTSCFWNVYLMGSVHYFLWNNAQQCCMQERGDYVIIRMLIDPFR